MFRSFLRVSTTAVLAACLLPVACARLPSQRPLLTQDPPAGERPAGAGPGARDASPEPKAYDKVITRDAKSDAGVFTVHRIKDKVFDQIPASELGKEFLWVTQIARTTLGAGYGGQAAGDEVVRWQAPRQPCAAPQGVLRHRRGQVAADLASSCRRQFRANRHELSISRTIGKDDAVCHRRHAAVHDRTAGDVGTFRVCASWFRFVASVRRAGYPRSRATSRC